MITRYALVSLLLIFFVGSCQQVIDVENKNSHTSTSTNIHSLASFNDAEHKLFRTGRSLYDQQINFTASGGEISLWGLAKSFKQRDTSSVVIVVPCLQKGKDSNNLEFDELVFTEYKNKVSSFRLNFKKQGDQSKGFSGITTIKSLDKKASKSFYFENGKLVTNTARDGGENEIAFSLVFSQSVIVRGFRQQPQAVWHVAGPEGASTPITGWEFSTGSFTSSMVFSEQALIDEMEQMLNEDYFFMTSEAERAILSEMGFWAQIEFRANVINATLEAGARFNTLLDCQDNRCNAFRHALFNALNAQSFTVETARRLGQARERNFRIDSQTFKPLNFSCSEPNIGIFYMDLLNNEMGYRAYNIHLQGGRNLSAIIWEMSQNNQLMNDPGCNE